MTTNWRIPIDRWPCRVIRIMERTPRADGNLAIRYAPALDECQSTRLPNERVFSATDSSYATIRDHDLVYLDGDDQVYPCVVENGAYFAVKPSQFR